MLAWSGDNPVEFTRAEAALQQAEIPIYPIAEHDQFTVPQIAGPLYRIFVPKSKAAEAAKAIAEVLREERGAGDTGKSGTKR